MRARPRICIATPVDRCGICFFNKLDLIASLSVINNRAIKCMLPHNRQNGGDIFLDIFLELRW